MKGLRGRESWPWWLSMVKVDGAWRARRSTVREMIADTLLRISWPLFNLADDLSQGWDEELDRDKGFVANVIGAVADFFYRHGCDLLSTGHDPDYEKLQLRRSKGSLRND